MDSWLHCFDQYMVEEQRKRVIARLRVHSADLRARTSPREAGTPTTVVSLSVIPTLNCERDPLLEEG